MLQLVGAHYLSVFTRVGRRLATSSPCLPMAYPLLTEAPLTPLGVPP